MAQKSTELEQYLQRVRELEHMYGQLEDALEDERHARQDEEAVRKLQARSVHSEDFTAKSSPNDQWTQVINTTVQALNLSVNIYIVNLPNVALLLLRIKVVNRQLRPHRFGEAAG